jgi:hypothetical protein
MTPTSLEGLLGTVSPIQIYLSICMRRSLYTPPYQDVRLPQLRARMFSARILRGPLSAPARFASADPEGINLVRWYRESRVLPGFTSPVQSP